MKRLVIFSLLLSTPVYATDLTLSDCLEVRSALNALDHYEDQTGKQKQYKLGALRITIALNMAALRHVPDTVDKSRLGLIAEIGNGKKIQEFSPPEMSVLNDKFKEMLDKTCDVKPAHIKISDLKIGDGPDENAIPPSVIAALAPILDQ